MPRQFPTVPYSESDDDNISYSLDLELNQVAGSTLVIGDTVFLSDRGVEVVAGTSGSYSAVNAYTFIDADGDEIGGMYGRDDSGQNVVGFRVVDEGEKDDNTVLEITSTSSTDAEANITIQTNRRGESTDTYLYLEKTDSSSEIDLMTKLDSGRVRIAPKLNLLGASAEIVDIYITGTYFVLKYTEASTTRYKYLDLSGTGATWVHSTSEP